MASLPEKRDGLKRALKRPITAEELWTWRAERLLGKSYSEIARKSGRSNVVVRRAILEKWVS